MTILEKLKNRYNILVITLVFIFLVIVFKLATLTIVQGDMYREMSENKRVKKLPITAPRGDIRDRYGRLLAGTIPSFTVQIMRDEIDNEKINDIALKLIKILEENGEDYTDVFPIKLNVFSYPNQSEAQHDNVKVEDEIIDILINNNLIPQLLDTFYINEDENSQFTFITSKKAQLVLENEGIDLPIKIDLIEDKEVIYYFDDNRDVTKWKKENNISDNLDAKSVLINSINNNEKIIRKILSDPIVRELTFKLLHNRGLANDYELVPYVFVYDMEYKEIKETLIKNSIPNITFDSNAKEDFINIILDKAIEDLLSSVFVRENGNGIERIIPGILLKEKFEENGIQLPITITVDEEANTVYYQFKDNDSKINFFSKENIQEEISPLHAFIQIGKKTGLIDDIITDDEVKYFAQELMLSKEINPKISISKWEYVPINEKNNWLTKMGISDAETAKEAFEMLRKKFSIEESYSDYEARYIFIIREQLLNQGSYKHYEPINISYGIKDRTVAKLLENNFELPGINVSVEPIRNYPMETTAAHILGYLGKISQEYEIEKYVQELGYSPNDIIGKTGIEGKFEEYLRGENGSKFVEVDVFGNIINVIDEEKATPGNDLFLTIDAKLQKVAEDSLRHALEEIQKGGEFKSKWGNYNYRESYKNATSGAVVAVDVKTGEVLALANYPAYDPNLFSTGISSEDWENLKPEHEEDPLAPRPLYNIAIRSTIQPGSTFKMITGLAALEKGIKPETKIRDVGYVEIGNQRFGCWIWNSSRGTHGWENLYEAIRDSCNYYFYSVTLGENLRTGEKLEAKVDIEDILSIAEDFGLNDKTGIEIPGEVSGRIPKPNIKINNTKRALQRFLQRNIRNYIKEDANLDDNDLEEAINEIVSWIDLEETMSRSQVMKGLTELGIDPDEKAGGRVSITDIIKYDYLNHAHWKQADTLNISIGQGQNSYTPIQMANYIATLVNGGNRNKVSVVHKITNYEGTETKYIPERETERVSLSDYNYLDEIKKGMLMVTSSGGTAYSVFRDFPVKVGAKTGTAEKDGINPATGEGYDNFAWFVAFAPYEDPEIAVSVLIFQGGSGGYAAPVAKEIIAEYLGLNNATEQITFLNKMVR